MRNLTGITIVLVAVFSSHMVAANCGKNSAFRYEFEVWARRYILAIATHVSESIENVLTITLSELNLEEEQESLFKNALNDWQNFRMKVTARKPDIEEIVNEFRKRNFEFDRVKDILRVIATKNMDKELIELENVAEHVSIQYADEILRDWHMFKRMEDFETLGQQADCKFIEEILMTMRRTEGKETALIGMCKALFEFFDMRKWSMLFSMSTLENNVLNPSNA